jgi:CelD/BcsL family acetyltransferase involved in cellulose biosynthesis
MDFVVDAGREREATLALLDAVAGLRWDIAEFNQVPQASPRADALLAWADGLRLHRSTMTVPCPVRRLPASFDALLADLPARLRTAVRSARKKLSQQYSVEFGQHLRSQELAEALDTLFANHAGRWHAKGQAGVFADARKRTFYHLLTPRLLQRGWLRFYFLKLDGRVVAQQYCFALDGTVMLLQEGFDYAHAHDNIGNALRACVFEDLIKLGASSYDFLAGTSRHKRSWSDTIVHDLRLRCARRSWRGWLFHALPRRLARWRDALRSLLGRSRQQPGDED